MMLLSKLNKLICSDIEKINLMAEKIVQNEEIEQKEAQINHDTICPHCHKSGDVVNRFALVHGNTENDTLITHWGLHKTINNLTIKTDLVNHCNNCGNEWEKYKVYSISKTEVIIMALIYLIEIMEDSDAANAQHKRDTVKIFNESYYESLLYLFEKYKHQINKKFPKSKLKRCYRSIKNT